MKRIIYFALSLMMVVSCGVSSASLGEHEAQSEAQKYAQAKKRNTVRAWGKYTGFSSMDLESFAAAVARQHLVEEIQTYIITSMDKNNEVNDLGTLDAGLAQQKLESLQKASRVLRTVSEGELYGSRIVMSDRYRQANGTVDCYVAVEISHESVEAFIKSSAKIREVLKESGIDVYSPEYKNTLTDVKKNYSDFDNYTKNYKLDISKF